MEILDSSEVIESFGIEYFRELSTFGALSDDFIMDLLSNGSIARLDKGDYIARYNEVANEFQVILKGKTAFYKHNKGCDVLTPTL